MISSARRVLFLQCTNAGAYPPIIHAAQIFADQGWSVDILSVPEFSTASLAVPRYACVTHHATRPRRQNAVRPLEYLQFLIKALDLSIRLRPDVVYASDPMGAGPALIAAHLADAALIYHEHDTPSDQALPVWLAHLRRAAALRAQCILVPNLERGRLLCQQTKQPTSKLRIVWNMPRRHEIPLPSVHEPDGLTIYFHGSITPDRLPKTVIDAAWRFGGRVRLLVAGYEAAGRPGYLAQLLAHGRRNERSIVEYLGQIPRENLLRVASKADVGLALMPNESNDVNMRHMVGASNKPFDYMAAGLALLVTDMPDWKATYCADRFGRACDPSDTESIARELTWFLDHPAELRSMGNKGRKKIQDEWNYDTAFAGVMDELKGS